MSKVPNCGFGGAYHIDFLGMPFRVSLPQFADENSRKINGQIFKTALSTLSARPGHSGNPATIWTIGHSTRPLGQFLGLLAGSRIEAIADVRSFPGSRKYPQYGKDALAATLTGDAIGYHWLNADTAQENRMGDPGILIALNEVCGA